MPVFYGHDDHEKVACSLIIVGNFNVLVATVAIQIDTRAAFDGIDQVLQKECTFVNMPRLHTCKQGDHKDSMEYSVVPGNSNIKTAREMDSMFVHHKQNTLTNPGCFLLEWKSESVSSTKFKLSSCDKLLGDFDVI